MTKLIIFLFSALLQTFKEKATICYEPNINHKRVIFIMHEDKFGSTFGNYERAKIEIASYSTLINVHGRSLTSNSDRNIKSEVICSQESAWIRLPAAIIFVLGIYWQPLRFVKEKHISCVPAEHMKNGIARFMWCAKTGWPYIQISG